MMIFGQERERRSRYNRQVQPWSTVGATPCMEQVAGPPMPTRIGNYYQTPLPHPWRPTIGYELVEAMPLPSQHATNAMVDPCYTPYGMATEPLKFPNLVTGFERNPAHAARAALYTRYTPLEWTQNALKLFNESDTNRNYSERLRGDFIRVMRETDEKTAQGQRESGRRLGERITDTTFWRNEVRTELERLIAEADLMQGVKRAVQKALDDIEGPLHIAQECLYHREKRDGIDMVHDIAEHALLKEIETYRNKQEQLRILLSKASDQMRNNRAAQAELEKDVQSKDSALGIDNMCHQLNNFSKGINYYGGIEKYDPTIFFGFNVQQEIFDLEKNIELLKKAIVDKSNPMRVAQTRLEARSHRKEIELCRDTAQDRLVYEVKDLQDSIEILHRKLQEAEAQHQQLLKTRSTLETDLHNKVNSLFIDREKCMGLRRSFPITATIKY
uniref:Tektin n=1 Tax=Diabrotica virgifera virgifera TaxID=50390 RepID=A0A6P7G6D6_DIAVI